MNNLIRVCNSLGDLVGCWNKRSAAGLYEDQSSNAIDLTLANSTALAPGIIGDTDNWGLKDLNGSDEWATIASASALQLASLSVMAVYRFDATGSSEYIVNKWNPAGNQRQWTLHKHTNEKIRLITSNNGTASSAVTGATVLSINTLYTVGATYANGGTVKIYIDGLPVSVSGTAKTSLFATGTSDFRIGAQGNGALEVTGDIGPCALFNTQKSEADMYTLHSAMVRAVARNRFASFQTRPQAVAGR